MAQPTNKPLTRKDLEKRIKVSFDSFEETMRKAKEAVDFVVLNNERQWRELLALKAKIEAARLDVRTTVEAFDRLTNDTFQGD